MDNQQAKELIEKYKAGQLTDVEKRILEDWYFKIAGDNKLNLEEGELEQNLDDIWKNIDLNTIEQGKRRSGKRSVIKLWREIAAAIAIFMVGIAVYLFATREHQNLRPQHQEVQNIISSGNRATLTLANGEVITLDSASNGKLAEQSGIVITKTKDGQLVYTIADQSSGKNEDLKVMNIISTPKGGQYQVNLPDGSKVWLNANSSLHYPARFTGDERSVTLTGEAYFEVAKTKTGMPFKVVTHQETVEVLGTHFNINAYADEPNIKTTLLEGAVKVSAINKEVVTHEVVLKPGQQSSLSGAHLDVSFVNTEEVIAWKNGMFMFKDADLKTVMRAVARWYDVDVAYEGVLPKREFSGEIYRNLNLNQVLDLLSFYKVHFRVEGKRIIVTP